MNGLGPFKESDRDTLVSGVKPVRKLFLTWSTTLFSPEVFMEPLFIAACNASVIVDRVGKWSEGCIVRVGKVGGVAGFGGRICRASRKLDRRCKLKDEGISKRVGEKGLERRAWDDIRATRSGGIMKEMLIGWDIEFLREGFGVRMSGSAMAAMISSWRLLGRQGGAGHQDRC